jgi:hypothetical protein
MTDPRLESWTVNDPPPGFTDRVMGAILRGDRSRGRSGKWLLSGGAVVLASAAAFAVFFRMGGGGEVLAAARTEVAIDAGTDAVLEQGAHIRWTRDGIEQDRGDVFYRASSGRAIRVHTPLVEISGRGPSYRVKLIDGAVIPAVLVSVAQGTVAIVTAAAHFSLGPGQYAKVERDTIRTDRDDVRGEIALELAPPLVRAQIQPAAAPAATAPPAAEPASTTKPPLPVRPARPSVQAPAAPSASSSRPAVILPRCDCDPRTPMCSCGAE